jgi:opacity protein-like surface antigen
MKYTWLLICVLFGTGLVGSQTPAADHTICSHPHKLVSDIHNHLLMKSFLLGWLLLVGSLSLAQTTRTDVIQKIDGSIIRGKVNKLTDSGIVYTGTSLPKTQKIIPRRQVWKIVFGDGRTEIITPRAVQRVATDKLVLTDKTVVVGKETRRDEVKLYYTRPNDPANTQRELLLSQLDRIQYADGREEIIPKPAVASAPATPVANAAQPAETAASGNAQSKLVSTESYSAPSVPVATKNAGGFARVHVTIGPEISLFSQSGVARWSNQYSGLGMNQSIGASLRFDYRLIQAVAVSFTGGYAQWELVRNYLQNNTEKYDETIQLTRIPVQVGVKLYPYKGFYLLPEAGVNLLMSSVKTTGTHPAPTNAQSSTTPITYGASLGYEFNLGGLSLDLSGRYQILDVKNLNFGAIAPSLTEKVQFGSLRLGIGFNAFKK